MYNLFPVFRADLGPPTGCSLLRTPLWCGTPVFRRPPFRSDGRASRRPFGLISCAPLPDRMGGYAADPMAGGHGVVETPTARGFRSKWSGVLPGFSYPVLCCAGFPDSANGSAASRRGDRQAREMAAPRVNCVLRPLIFQRGNRRQTVFFRTSDYLEYLRLLSEWCKKEKVAVWAYCLMPNHVHLVVVPEMERSLARTLGEVHRRYTRMINFRKDWRGFLWQGRFASFPLDDEYLYRVIR